MTGIIIFLCILLTIVCIALFLYVKRNLINTKTKHAEKQAEVRRGYIAAKWASADTHEHNARVLALAELFKSLRIFPFSDATKKKYSREILYAHRMVGNSLMLPEEMYVRKSLAQFCIIFLILCISIWVHLALVLLPFAWFLSPLVNYSITRAANYNTTVALEKFPLFVIFYYGQAIAAPTQVDLPMILETYLEICPDDLRDVLTTLHSDCLLNEESALTNFEDTWALYSPYVSKFVSAHRLLMHGDSMATHLLNNLNSEIDSDCELSNDTLFKSITEKVEMLTSASLTLLFSVMMIIYFILFLVAARYGS